MQKHPIHVQNGAHKARIPGRFGTERVPIRILNLSLPKKVFGVGSKYVQIPSEVLGALGYYKSRQMREVWTMNNENCWTYHTADHCNMHQEVLKKRKWPWAMSKITSQRRRPIANSALVPSAHRVSVPKSSHKRLELSTYITE